MTLNNIKEYQNSFYIMLVCMIVVLGVSLTIFNESGLGVKTTYTLSIIISFIVGFIWVYYVNNEVRRKGYFELKKVKE